MKQKAVIYVRVSTNEQTKGYSLASQIKGCQDYADRLNLEVIDVVEESVSGATRLDEREGGRELLSLANDGIINAIIVWRLDRLSRPPEDEMSRLQTTIEHFSRKGVEIHDCESGPVRNGDMAATMIAFFKGIVASQERAATRERTIRGRINKAKNGKWVGNGQPPYGFRKIGNGRENRLVVDQEQATIVQRIFNMYLGQNGEDRVPSLRSLAERLTLEGIPSSSGGKWYAATIQRMMSSRTYLGEFTYSDITINLPELAVVEEQTWRDAQAQLRNNQVRAKRNRKREYLVANRIRCSCGGRMGGTAVKPKSKEYMYYSCNRQNAYGHITDCHERLVRADKADALVWERIRDIISDEETVRDGLREMRRLAERELEPISERLALVEVMIDKTDRKVRRLLDAFSEEDNSSISDALQSQIRELAVFKENQKKERDALRQKVAQRGITQEFEDEVVVMVNAIRDQIRYTTFEEKRSLLDVLEVEVHLRREEEDRFLELTMAITPETLPIAYHASLKRVSR